LEERRGYHRFAQAEQDEVATLLGWEKPELSDGHTRPSKRCASNMRVANDYRDHQLL
jgi:hypothetical protein